MRAFPDDRWQIKCKSACWSGCIIASMTMPMCRQNTASWLSHFKYWPTMIIMIGSCAESARWLHEWLTCNMGMHQGWGIPASLTMGSGGLVDDDLNRLKFATCRLAMCMGSWAEAKSSSDAQFRSRREYECWSYCISLNPSMFYLKPQHNVFLSLVLHPKWWDPLHWLTLQLANYD